MLLRLTVFVKFVYFKFSIVGYCCCVGVITEGALFPLLSFITFVWFFFYNGISVNLCTFLTEVGYQIWMMVLS